VKCIKKTQFDIEMILKKVYNGMAKEIIGIN